MMDNKRAGWWVASIALLASTHAPRARAVANCPEATCVPITVNVNLHYTHLHPLITNLQVVCSSHPSGYAFEGHSPLFQIANREFIGNVAIVIPILLAAFYDPANRTLNVLCTVNIHRRDGTGGEASASLSVPTLPSDSNYRSLDANSDTRWSGDVIIPNKNAP